MDAIDLSVPVSVGRMLRLACLIAGLLPAQGPAHATSAENEYLKNVQQVTDQFVKAGEGYFSPDGNQVVYQAITHGYPFYQIYSQSLNGGAPRRISTGRGRTTCSYFSPAGNRILYASSHLDPRLAETESRAYRNHQEDQQTGQRRRYQWVFDPHMDIFEADLQGNILCRLTNASGYDAECAYAPHGESIVFCSDRDGDPDLYLMDRDGSNVRQLTNEPGYDGGPFISPNGRWVVYRTDRDRKDFLQIHVVGVDGNGDVALTDNVGVNWAPYWHPTKPYLIWSGADHSNPKSRPNYDLWAMRYQETDQGIEPGRIIRLTDDPAADVLPVFSPDGTRLLWTSNRTTNRSSQLWIADVELPE